MKKLIFLLLIVGGFFYRVEIQNTFRNLTKDKYSFPQKTSKGSFDLFYNIRKATIRYNPSNISISPSLGENFIKIKTDKYEAMCDYKKYKRDSYTVYKCHVEKDLSGVNEYVDGEFYALFNIEKEINISTDREEIIIKLNTSDNLICLEDHNGMLAGKWNSAGCINGKYSLEAELIK
ncbi:MAG: hypothetical protein N4A44_02015 [Alphaproteobacteria bacterium]|jgi:hypothetical protein|nr:hypothetical protein [Alphaproteobacteria bacterium]